MDVRWLFLDGRRIAHDLHTHTHDTKSRDLVGLFGLNLPKQTLVSWISLLGYRLTHVDVWSADEPLSGLVNLTAS
jgi:hypothetical protein